MSSPRHDSPALMALGLGLPSRLAWVVPWTGAETQLPPWVTSCTWQGAATRERDSFFKFAASRLEPKEKRGWTMLKRAKGEMPTRLCLARARAPQRLQPADGTAWGPSASLSREPILHDTSFCVYTYISSLLLWGSLMTTQVLRSLGSSPSQKTASFGHS